MSVNYLRIIPNVTAWTPDPTIVNQIAVTAQELFATRSKEVSVADRGEVVFVDSGARFETVSCANCGAPIDLSWWQDRMDGAAEIKFTDLAVRTGCCGFDTALDDLAYEPPAGFARFVIEIRGLDQTYADDDAMAALERIAGNPLRQIAARY